MPSLPLNIRTPDGILDGHVVYPAGDGSWPAVILYMDAMGIRPELVGMAERLAVDGYVVVLPNLYYRSGPQPLADKIAFASPGPERDRVFALLQSINHAMVMRDTEAMLEFLDQSALVSRLEIGAVGYCMGGGYALSAAGTFPDRVAAAASFHGGALATDRPDSPHRLAGSMRGMLYIGVAGIDPMFPPEECARLEAALTAAGCRFTLEIYPDVRHGFAVTGNVVYDAAASERHWERLRALFKRVLIDPVVKEE